MTDTELLDHLELFTRIDPLLKLERNRESIEIVFKSYGCTGYGRSLRDAIICSSDLVADLVARKLTQ